MKKSYNPFKMWLSYVLAVAFVFVAVLGFYLNLTSTAFFSFLDSITLGELYKITLFNGANVGLFNPIAMLNLFVYGFVLGFIIQSVFRLLRKK